MRSDGVIQTAGVQKCGRGVAQKASVNIPALSAEIPHRTTAPRLCGGWRVGGGKPIETSPCLQRGGAGWSMADGLFFKPRDSLADLSLRSYGIDWRGGWGGEPRGNDITSMTRQCCPGVMAVAFTIRLAVHGSVFLVCNPFLLFFFCFWRLFGPGARAPTPTVTDRRGRPTDGRAAPPLPPPEGQGFLSVSERRRGSFQTPSCRKG